MDSKGQPEPLSDERLRAVTVGELSPLEGSILLAPYDPDRPRRYAASERQICAALGTGTSGEVPRYCVSTRNSMRRFLARLVSVSFGAMGRVSP
jgi:hypothetical protein